VAKKFSVQKNKLYLLFSILALSIPASARAESEIEALRREVAEQRTLIRNLMATWEAQKTTQVSISPANEAIPSRSSTTPAPVPALSVAPTPALSVYGVADVDVTRTNSGYGYKTNIGSSGYSASRLGIKGEKSLRPNISAVYLMEAGLALNTGVVGTGTLSTGLNNNVASSGGLTSGGSQIFSRQIYAGLKLPFGAITLGRQYSGSYLASVAESTTLGAGLYGSSGTFLPVVASMPTRLNNSMVYVSPKLSGFSAHLTVTSGAGNNVNTVAGAPTNATTDRAGRGADVAMFYSSGRLKTAITTWNLRNASFNVSQRETGLATRKGFQVGAGYDLGFARVNATYVVGKIAGAGYENGTKSLSDVSGWSVSGGIPVAGGTVLASFTRVDDKSLLPDRGADLIGIAYTYKLFDTTTLYGNWGRLLNKRNASYSLPNGGDLVGTVAMPGFNPSGSMVGLNQTF